MRILHSRYLVKLIGVLFLWMLFVYLLAELLGGPSEDNDYDVISDTWMEPKSSKSVRAKGLLSGKEPKKQIQKPKKAGQSHVKPSVIRVAREPVNIIPDQPPLTKLEFQEEVENQARQLVRRELAENNFPIDNLNKYLVDKGGSPVRTLIVSTWRSGSSFLGEIIQTHPATFYHFEPLVHLVNAKRAKGTSWTKEQAESLVNDTLRCFYKRHPSFTDKIKKHEAYFYERNPRVGKLCQGKRHLCHEPNFHSKLCKQFPFQTMKLVRLRLNLTASILNDHRFRNTKIIYLVRDPRGTMRSRDTQWSWCGKNPHCGQPAIMCSDLVKDFHSAEKLALKYPGRIMVLRYEDLTADIYTAVRKIFKFLGLIYGEKTAEFLETHTQATKGNSFSLHRNTKSAPYHWIPELGANFSRVQGIQDACATAMDLWGYAAAPSQTQLLHRNFDPLLPPPDLVFKFSSSAHKSRAAKMDAPPPFNDDDDDTIIDDDVAPFPPPAQEPQFPQARFEHLENPSARRAAHAPHPPAPAQRKQGHRLSPEDDEENQENINPDNAQQGIDYFDLKEDNFENERRENDILVKKFPGNQIPEKENFVHENFENENLVNDNFVNDNFENENLENDNFENENRDNENLENENHQNDFPENENHQIEFPENENRQNEIPENEILDNEDPEYHPMVSAELPYEEHGAEPGKNEDVELLQMAEAEAAGAAAPRNKNRAKKAKNTET